MQILATQTYEVTSQLTNARDALKAGDRALAMWFFGKAIIAATECYKHWDAKYEERRKKQEITK